MTNYDKPIFIGNNEYDFPSITLGKHVVGPFRGRKVYLDDIVIGISSVKPEVMYIQRPVPRSETADEAKALKYYKGEYHLAMLKTDVAGCCGVNKEATDILVARGIFKVIQYVEDDDVSRFHPMKWFTLEADLRQVQNSKVTRAGLINGRLADKQYMYPYNLWIKRVLI